PFGIHRIVIGEGRMAADTISVSINEETVNLGVLTLAANEAMISSAQQLLLPTIALEDRDSDEENGSATGVSSLLTASRDPFINTAAFTFGAYRFQARGYDRSQQQVLINGAPMNDVETGSAYWSQWGGLNDVFRSRSTTYGLQPSDYAFGGINGTTAF